VLSGAQQLGGFLKMEMVWCTEVHNLNGIVVGKFFERTVGTREPERVASGFRAFGSAPENAPDWNAKTPERVEVRASDKT